MAILMNCQEICQSACRNFFTKENILGSHQTDMKLDITWIAIDFFLVKKIKRIRKHANNKSNVHLQVAINCRPCGNNKYIQLLNIALDHESTVLFGVRSMRMRFGTFDNLQDRRDNAPKVPNTFFLVSSCLFYLRFLSIDPKGFFHGSHPPGLFSFSLLPLLLLLFFCNGLYFTSPAWQPHGPSPATTITTTIIPTHINTITNIITNTNKLP